MSFVRRLWLDALLGVAALAVSAPSLAYPLGRDQGLYFYVAREWVLGGKIPYRDVLDHKTPGIYLLYGLAVQLFGGRDWGIRLIDLVGVALAGVTAAWLSAAPGEKVLPGVRGASWLTLAILYYGYLDFWNTAQSELWYSLLALASVVVVVHGAARGRTAFLAGLLAGAALLMKPPAIWIVFVALWQLSRRHLEGRADAGRSARLRRLLGPVLLYGTGAAVVVAAVLGYLVAKGAFPAFIDIVVGANGYYVTHEPGIRTLVEATGEYLWCYAPIFPGLVVYLVLAIRRARRAADRATLGRHVLVASVLVAGLAAILMQRKYYLLHWSVLLPIQTAIAANVYRAAIERSENLGGRHRWLGALPVLLGIWALSAFTMGGFRSWLATTTHCWRYARGQESAAQFAGHFAVPPLEFWYLDGYLVGEWLKRNSRPDDLVAVRSFEPQIYAIAGRRHEGRFFWTTFLTSPHRAYRRAEWLREDREALVQHPPRYMVSDRRARAGPDSPAFAEKLGYRVVERIAHFDIMERPPPAP